MVLRPVDYPQENRGGCMKRERQKDMMSYGQTKGRVLKRKTGKGRSVPRLDCY